MPLATRAAFFENDERRGLISRLYRSYSIKKLRLNRVEMGKFTLQIAAALFTFAVLFGSLATICKVVVRCRRSRQIVSKFQSVATALLRPCRRCFDALCGRWGVRTFDRSGMFYEARSGLQVRGRPLFSYVWAPEPARVANVNMRPRSGPPGLNHNFQRYQNTPYRM